MVLKTIENGTLRVDELLEIGPEKKGERKEVDRRTFKMANKMINNKHY